VCTGGEEKEESGGFPPGELQKYFQAREASKFGNNRRLARRMRQVKAEKRAAKEAREKAWQVKAATEPQEEVAWGGMKSSLAARGKCGW
jgi:phosphopantetheinyl transferase (holo-ACP synthase)